MSFLFPQYLWWLLGLPLVGVLLLLANMRSRRTIELFLGARRKTVVLNVLLIKNFVTAVLFTASVGSLIIAFSGPRWGEVSVEDERRGLDLVFLVDVSNSMSAQDVFPSRLGRSREIARAVADRLPEAHKAIVAFKGAASVVVPMTEDPVAFELAVGHLSGNLITSGGTSIESGVTVALSAFPPGTPRHRAILLLSDGDELQGAVERELDGLREARVPIFAVVTGSRDGATIPTRDGDVLRDQTGEPVLARSDEATMQRLVDASGGRLYDVSDSGIAQTIADDLREVAGTGRDVLFEQVAVDRYHMFVLLSLGALVAMVLVQSVRWRNIV